MKPGVKKILRQALCRAKEDTTFDWKNCKAEDKLSLIQMYTGIIIIELELSEFAHDLNLETIKEIRRMTIDEWGKALNEIYEKLPDLTNRFIVETVRERVNAGYEKFINLETGNMKVILNEVH
jgi:hypothetical protein